MDGPKGCSFFEKRKTMSAVFKSVLLLRIFVHVVTNAVPYTFISTIVGRTVVPLKIRRSNLSAIQCAVDGNNYSKVITVSKKRKYAYPKKITFKYVNIFFNQTGR